MGAGFENDSVKEITQRIIELRDVYGYTQEEFAEQLGISAETYMALYMSMMPKAEQEPAAEEAPAVEAPKAEEKKPAAKRTRKAPAKKAEAAECEAKTEEKPKRTRKTAAKKAEA